MTLADQIVILDRGQIQQIGSPQAVYHQPVNRMVASFLGNPPMNMLPATYHQGMWQIGDSLSGGYRQQTLPCPPLWQQKSGVSTNSPVNLLEATRFDLGIRPEHLHLSLDSQSKSPQSPPMDADVPVNFPTLSITVELVEPLGKETLIRGRIGADIILNLLVAGLWQGRVGDRLSVVVDLSQLFLFDYQTGKTLIFADN